MQIVTFTNLASANKQENKYITITTNIQYDNHVSFLTDPSRKSFEIYIITANSNPSQRNTDEMNMQLFAQMIAMRK